MDPTPPPTNAPQPGPHPVVEFVRTNRETASYILLGLSAAFLICTVWLSYKGVKASAAPPATEQTDKDEKDKKTSSKKGDDPLGRSKEEPTEDRAGRLQVDYIVGALGVLMGFLITAASGVWLSVGTPAPSEDQQRTDARMVLLIVGGIVGTVLMLLGAFYFYSWSSSLTAWLNQDKTKEAVWVVVPLLMVAVGAGLVLASVQPARAEERNNPTVRRLVYGANMAVSVLLLIAVLVAGNVIIALRVPSLLDVRASAVTALDDTTREYLAGMDQPVDVYLILPEGSQVTVDTRQLLERMKEAAPPGMLNVRAINPTADRDELRRLMQKFPVLVNGEGVLLTTGEGREPAKAGALVAGATTQRHAFIRYGELTGVEGAPGKDEREVFRGQSRILRELKFLAEGGQKPILYFTQGNGELEIEPRPARQGDPTQSATTLRRFLERNYFEVRALTIDENTTQVPPDASAVVVLNPSRPMNPATVKAIDEYVIGRKGALLVLSGPQPRDQRGEVIATGLEPVLTKLGVDLQPKVIYSSPVQGRDWAMEEVVALPAEQAKGNPLASQFDRRGGVGPWYLCRPVLPRQTSGFQVTPLFVCPEERSTFQFPGEVLDPLTVYEQVRRNPRLQAQTDFAKQGGPPVAVTVTEGGKPRAVVLGCGSMAANVTPRDMMPGAEAQPGPELDDLALISSSIDWLRERKSIGSDKDYGTYAIAANADSTRLILVPILLTMGGILGLGVGVWVIRRR